ncbi:cuticle protein 7-like [Macrobrachium rosenbergii]|uniref:cuticle protein 7-like n=1 Tax=Macrobrachium rosenbergii TaxID=79674 RepID=UPI0034D4BF9A
MFKKVILLFLAVSTLASPHKLAPSGYGYSVPKHPLSYAPHAPAYEAPEPSYSTPGKSYRAPSYEEEDEEGKPFEFEYAVQDHYNGLDFAHNENSDGTVVSGQYHVLLPDGRTQIVTYTADADNGYQAEVTYEGEAQYPEPHPDKPTPSYHAPAHSYSAPAHSYSGPAHSYSAPAHSYSTPTHSYSAPSHSYSAPAHSYSAPEHSYSAPAHSYSAAPHTYGQPHGNPHH